jgi:hypothetical protein
MYEYVALLFFLCAPRRLMQFRSPVILNKDLSFSVLQLVRCRPRLPHYQSLADHQSSWFSIYPIYIISALETAFLNNLKIYQTINMYICCQSGHSWFRVQGCDEIWKTWIIVFLYQVRQSCDLHAPTVFILKECFGWHPYPSTCVNLCCTRHVILTFSFIYLLLCPMRRLK